MMYISKVYINHLISLNYSGIIQRPAVSVKTILFSSIARAVRRASAVHV